MNHVTDCRYAVIEEIPTVLPVNKLSILLLNIRSCRKNFDNFLSYFSNYVCKYSLIVLVETWLTQGFCKLLSICGFKHLDSFRANDGGGIRIYHKNTIDVKLLPDFSSVSDVFEVLTVEIACPEKNVLFSVYYHPPTPDHTLNRVFIEQCFSMIELQRSVGLPVIACGDFNLNLFNPLKLRYVTDFINGMLELSMFPAITVPTKYNPDNAITKFSLIDHVWTNIPSKTISSFVIPTGISDHFPVSMSFDLTSQRNVSCHKKRVFNARNNAAFTSSVSDINLRVINNDMNMTYNYYFSSVYDLYNAAFPLMTKVIKDGKDCPWITPAIKICIKKKAKLYRMYIRGTIDKVYYTLFRNHMTSLVRRAKRLYYFRLFLQETNASKLWYRIITVLGNSTGVSMECLKVDGNTHRGVRMVNHANSYFVNIAANLTANLQNNEPYVVTFTPNPFSFAFLPTDANEVFMVIMSLKNKGNGLNDISALSLKKNAQIFSVHMAFLYNLSIERVTYPNGLKVACVCPDFKSGAKDSVDNYRPISNLPIISKVFEKLTLIRLISFVKRYNLLSDCQFGFREGRSITQAAIRLTTFITNAYHQRLYSACFYLDLRKAFDTIDHPILFMKLHKYGFRGPVYDYLTSYLSSRKQYVMVGDDKSDELEITKGVPQGSMIGPLLFLLYINDIVKAVEPDVEVVLFADDAAFFLSAPSLQLLYDKLKTLFSNLSSYLNKNKLVPNLKKSKLMMFSSRPCGPLEDITFGNEVIEWVKEYKYLGLTLTSSMSFGPHIDCICTKISQCSGIFYYLYKYLPREVMLLLYNTFALPHLILHIELWGAAPG